MSPSNLTDYSERELRLAGFFDKDSDYHGALGVAALELIKAFADQEHSGFSAGLTVELFRKLAQYEPLLPLTGEESEWDDVRDGLQQNNRCSRVFRKNGQAYDVEGVIFRNTNGTCFTNGKSRVFVTFPYVPKHEYLEVSVDD